MNKNIPDKWLRKAIYDRLNNIAVRTELIPVFDYRITGDDLPNDYILLSTQSNQVDKNNKCEWFWNSQILIDIVTSYPKPGNTGSRLKADDILNIVRDKTKDLQLDINSGLEIIAITQDFPSDIIMTTESENIFRKFLRLELTIK